MKKDNKLGFTSSSLFSLLHYKNIISSNCPYFLSIFLGLSNLYQIGDYPSSYTFLHQTGKHTGIASDDQRISAASGFNQLKHVVLQLLLRSKMSTEREQRGMYKKRKPQINEKSISKPQIKIPAHLETLAWWTIRKQISQKDEVQ